MADLQVPEKRFRPEIEGVRAVAAFLVAIYHIWLGSVSGGVDVFFIVSGYLITTTLLTRMEREGRINLFENVLGLARRLFPIAFIVLLFTAIFSILLLPQSQWEQTIGEIFSSAFYYQNWQLANSAIDYLAQNNNASPLQHFWALSIQGQFYITWPFVILLSFFLANKVFKTPVRKTLLGLLITFFVVSIGYSIYITAVNQPWAYFDTFARVWEFSLGGILALLLPYLKFNKAVSAVIGWIGLAVIAFTGMVLPVSSLFPGYVALLPTTGVIFVILAAENGSRFGVENLLGSKPFLYFGGISYAFYLWHWPLLIFYYSYWDTDTVSIPGGVGIIATAFVLSVLSSKILESPVRTISVKSKIKLPAILVTFMLPALLVTYFWGDYVNQSQETLYKDYDVENYPGALSVSDNIEASPDKEPLPTAVQAEDDLPEFYGDNCYTGLEGSEVTSCSYGVTDNPDYTVALVGGSHSGHWFPALKELSEDLNLQIDVYNKDGCRFSDEDFDGALSESCMVWNEKVVDTLKSDPPDLVFSPANVNDGATIPEGYIHQWEKLEGITKALAVRDTPRMAEDIPLCLEENSPDECAIPTEDAMSENPPWENTDAEDIPNNVTFADLTTDYFCNDETCEPVIGNVVVYRDYNHISTLYSKTLAPALKEHLVSALKKTE
ncbi:acyltransferase [Salibacterium salarium]|uniref:Acyltransferase n=1 Tax=Salibacterium salarium TaxID=284579 RepID=A0A428NAL8_9BACI|nr:acyltransferase family protein [Salibacterium salarium]RSL35381.1 acyltransferase [Salibacterium salarium]